MLSLPLITPRDSHELWFGSSQTPYRSSASQNQSNPSDPHQSSSRRYQGHNNLPSGRTLISSTAPSNTLAALQLEERALRARKQNIASFGYAWIKPAGCAKTMLGMREEEAEREEGLLAAAAEMASAGDLTMGMVDEFGRPQGAEGEGDTAGADDQMLERDLDDDIPDADADGLVEEGEEGLEEDEDADEGLMERDLDDDIPEAFPDDDDDDDDDDDEEEEDDFDNQPDLDDDIPAAEDGDDLMVRDLDDDVPEAAEDGSEQGEEWQHTDTEAEDDDDDEHDPFAEQLLRTSTSSARGLPPQPPPIRRETEAQRRFLNRWSGGADAFDSSMMVEDEEDLRASIASQASRRNSNYRRRFSRRTGGPRDSLE